MSKILRVIRLLLLLCVTHSVCMLFSQLLFILYLQRKIGESKFNIPNRIINPEVYIAQNTNTHLLKLKLTYKNKTEYCWHECVCVSIEARSFLK